MPARSPRPDTTPIIRLTSAKENPGKTGVIVSGLLDGNLLSNGKTVTSDNRDIIVNKIRSVTILPELAKELPLLGGRLGKQCIPYNPPIVTSGPIDKER